MPESPVMESNLRHAEVDLIWLDAPPCVRSTRARLRISLGLATSITLVALLAFEVNLKVEPVKSTARREMLLSVNIRSSEPGQRLDAKPGGTAQAPRAADQRSSKEPERVDASRPRSRAAADADPGDESVSSTDWHALRQRVAEETVDDHWRKERLRASLWRQTRSVMFHADSHAGAGSEAQPLIADLDFRKPAGVLGLGFTFGSCFVGIPLAGIPVEERSTAITLFYCRE